MQLVGFLLFFFPLPFFKAKVIGRNRNELQQKMLFYNLQIRTLTQVVKQRDCPTLVILPAL